MATLRYGAAIFAASALLFLIEPMAGKRILPLLGGSAAVWTACLVFFQCALLIGYWLAHLLVTRAPVRVQVGTYLALLAASLVQLLVAPRAALHADAGHPVTSVLLLLTLFIGLPFVTLSASSPLLQAWFARETAGGAGTYRLYALSNLGSLLGLLVYPWLVEPRWSLRGQFLCLTAGLVVLAGLVAVGLAVPLRRAAAAAPEPQAEPHAATARPTFGDRALWILLAACGSMLLSAFTVFLSQNVVTVPLLWILPLVAYLLSWVAAFSGERWRPRWLVLALASLGLTATGMVLTAGGGFTSVPRVVVTFCTSLFFVCLLCHAELHRRRPAAERLTSFYFHVSAGGALGAILVGVAAPALLDGSYELALGLCLAAGLAGACTWSSGRWARTYWAVALGLLVWVLVHEVRSDARDRVAQMRNFYGTLRVTDGEERGLPVRTLLNGTIIHGQEVRKGPLHGQPTTYYGHTTGIGIALEHCCGAGPRRVGVIGLGAGTLAAYGRAGDAFRFYEINPISVLMAQQDFSFLRDTPAHVETVLGDARVSLASEPPQKFDLLAIDAFTGDAIPVHLLTREALQVYLHHLAPGGILAFHISNSYVDLAPVVEALAEDAGLDAALVESPDDLPRDVFISSWMLVTARKEFLRDPAVAPHLRRVSPRPDLRLWTDDYSSLLPLLILPSK